MRKIFTSIILSILLTLSYGQTIDLTFTGIDNVSYIKLDSIKIINCTQGCDTTLYWPDTVLSINFTGLIANTSNEPDFKLLQNFPNPVMDETMVSMQIPQKDKVSILVSDISGRAVIKSESTLERGIHTFRFRPGSEKQCVFTVQWKGYTSSIKIINAVSRTGGSAKLDYMGIEGNYDQLKETNVALGFCFSPGDELLYAGYMDNMESGIHATPEVSQFYTFQFATDIPCPGMPTIEYGGQVYNTVQICSQCWLKENLNIGVMVDAPNPQTNNDTIEKYCMGNMNSYCVIWGGLYFWGEVMNYNFTAGGQGICPEGWHIPSEMDWQILEGVADSVYGIGDPLWDDTGFRGLDAGGKLKQSGNEYWMPPNTGASNAYGFTAYPGGYFVQNEFWGPQYKGIFWGSGPPYMFVRNMDWNEARIRKAGANSGFAGSVRCIKD